MTGVTIAPKRVGIRSDIQALRAIAVVAVLVGHFFPVRLAGGFIGVDVFFVVSGFLITLHLLHELDSTGRLKLGRFYVRRARRLLPAAYAVLAVSLAGALILLPVSRWRDTAIEIFASAAYYQNWLLAFKDATYNAEGVLATVVRHYWSLSLEEQFYLMWPLLLIVGFGFAARIGKSPRIVFTLLLLIVSVASFWSAVVVTSEDMTFAYFVTYTRVWEFAVGALLAVAAPFLQRVLARWGVVRGVMQWAGLLMIALAVVWFDAETEFPGPWAALPVLGTALVIAAGPEVPRFTPMRLLAVRPVQFTGDISYSIYLWHWPVLILAPFVLGGSLSIAQRFVLMVLIFGLAWLTKQYIEDPGRTRAFSTWSNRKIFGAIAVSITAFALVTFPVTQLGQARVDADRAALAERAASQCFGAAALDGENCADPYGATDLLVVGASESPMTQDPVSCVGVSGSAVPLERCDFSGADSDANADANADAKHVWLVGNAGVNHWKSAVVQLAQEQGWVLTISAKEHCALMPGPAPKAQFDLSMMTGCLQHTEKLGAAIAEAQPDLVVASQAAKNPNFEHDAAAQDWYFEASQRFADGLNALGTQIAVIRDVPETLSVATPECLELHPDDPLVCANDRAAAVAPDPFADAFEQIGGANVTVVDLTDAFCDEDRCYALIGGLPVHFDAQHLARSYSLSLVPRLEAELVPLLDA